jgi:DNA-binding NarL/FixJ family response regulator
MRVIFVSGAQPDRDLLRRGAAGVSVPIDVLECGNSNAVRELLGNNEIDIVFLDAALDAVERAAIVGLAQKARPAPFVIFVATDRNEARALAEAGADGAIIRPASVDDATQALERCMRVRLPHRVLVVDDSQTMRSIVRKILAAGRFRLEVAEAPEGIEALKQIASGKFDLVFLDYTMPGLNGLETLSEIRRLYPQIRVVIMTSNADDDLVQRARMAGAAAFLKKPFYPADIDAILHRLLGVRVVR